MRLTRIFWSNLMRKTPQVARNVGIAQSSAVLNAETRGIALEPAKLQTGPSTKNSALVFKRPHLQIRRVQLIGVFAFAQQITLCI